MAETGDLYIILANKESSCNCCRRIMAHSDDRAIPQWSILPEWNSENASLRSPNLLRIN